MKTFTFTPKSEVKRSVQYLDRTIEFESGAFQVQEIGINPIITFQMTFESMAAEMASLEAFYMEHRKSKRIYLHLVHRFQKEHFLQKKLVLEKLLKLDLFFLRNGQKESVEF